MMRPDFANRRGTRLLRPAGALVVGTLIASSFGGPAAAQQDFTRQVLNGLSAIGLTAPEQPDIEYRERPPLVVPPSAEMLPPPRDASAVAGNPAWPKGYDKQIAEKQAVYDAPFSGGNTKRGGGSIDPTPLKPSELERGRRAGTVVGSGFDSDRDNRLSPRQLEFKGWNISGKEKPLVFSGEPEREALVQPPPGYQTPAPNAPYGVVEEKKKEWTLPSWFDRTQPNAK